MKTINRMSIALIAIIFGMASCSKGGDNNPSPTTGKNIKMTIKVEGAKSSETDYVSVAVAGADLNGSTTIWKVNGVTKNNEVSFGLGGDDFVSTTTYEIESIKALNNAGLNLQFINFDTPFKISYKVTVNGTTQVEENNVSIIEDNHFRKSMTF